MEDEEVVFEGHQLHLYLHEQGYTDFELVKPEKYTTRNSSKELLKKWWEKSITIEVLKKWFLVPHHKLYEFLRLDLNKILDSGLLLEEDYMCVKNIADPIDLNNPKPLWSGVSILHGAITAASLMLWRGAKIQWFFPASCACLAVGHYLSMWRVSHQLKQISEAVEILLTTAKEFFFLLRKNIIYIQENEILLRGFILAQSSVKSIDVASDKKPNWYKMTGLRESVSQTEKEIISILQTATQDLVYACPLSGQLDNICHYTAFLPPGELTADSGKSSLGYMKNLQTIYLQLQSEFLRRLSLSFLVHLWKNEEQTIKPLTLIIMTMSSEFDKCKNILLNDYKYFSCFGFSVDNDKTTSHLSDLKHKPASAYIGIHSARLHLQGMLHKTIEIEQMVQQKDNEENEVLTEDLVNRLNSVIAEMDSCKTCMDITISHLKALNHPVDSGCDTKSPLPVSWDLEKINFRDPIPVGYSDLDPKVEDEVFIAKMDSSCPFLDESDEYIPLSEEEKLKLLHEKENSERIMSELKNVLVHKAQEMKEREARALRSKNQLSGEDWDDDSGESDIDDLSDAMMKTVDSKSDVDVSSGINTLTSPDIDWPRARLPNLWQAKDLLGEEQIFCDSGESDLEDETACELGDKQIFCDSRDSGVEKEILMKLDDKWDDDDDVLKNV